MKLNEHIALSTPKVLLVPYSEHHVPAYHDWMEDEDLRIATASERLSLDEEYDMQRTWRNDADKLTFILAQPLQDSAATAIAPGVDDTSSRLIGDINLFLVAGDEDEDPEEGAPEPVVGELELMIAVKEQRRRGYGTAALEAFVLYIRDHLDAILAEYNSGKDSVLSYLRVKIGAQNAGSIALFEGIGFKKITDVPNYFGEFELRRNIESMYNGCDGLREVPYKLDKMSNGI